MPRGSLPAGVYWRRRVLVLGSIVAVIFALVSFVRGLGDDPQPPPRAVQASAETTPSAPSTTPTDATPRQKGNKQKRPNKGKNKVDGTTTTPQEQSPPPQVEVLPDPTGTCDDSDIRISPLVLGAVAGRRVAISLQLRTEKAVACTWRFNSKSVVLKITRNGEDVWTSWRCQRQVPNVSAVVRRDTTTIVDFNWRARTSTNTCGKMAPWADPGTYQIRASTFGGVPSDEVEFTLARP